MSKLMDELMAEINRVKNLEIEVATTVKQQSNETKLARTEKAKEIRKFLEEILTSLIEAKVCVPKEKSYTRSYYAIVNTDCVYAPNPKEYPRYTIRLKFTGESVDMMYASSEPYLFYVGCNTGSVLSVYDCANALVDQWSENTYALVERQIAEVVSKKIAERIEQATDRLKKANAEHAKYYGKEG